ncbi:LOW QUALITY PROTEIN: hypothetical protein Cgig2_028308 [Carnegiea gigantea]|uniref:Ubiquitin-like protease family profile domain-containing protein n=1 Tax=Carnegiea gigantea TaxID=171969 RepID=A0A9Q1GQB7_9CARY|nr:LOW QUALITY PROTEIN: hypothetical protein Cgig2_028308 [Carnegiea gigantea]
MKLRSEQESRERAEGSKVTGECAKGEASAAVGKRKRRIRGEKLGSGDAEVSKSREGVSGSRRTDKDGKGKEKREGKRLKEDVDGGRGRNGKGREKGNVAGDTGARVGVSGSGNDVILRSRCTLRSICALHGRLTPYQRDAILGTVLRPVLEYGEMAMERHLMVALIQAWDRRRKAFRIAGREVRFTVYDVVLFTGLPGTGKKVELDREEVSTEVGDMVRARMGEWERKEMERRVPRRSGKKRRFFKHYVNVMMEMCARMLRRTELGYGSNYMHSFGVLFPCTPYGAAWSLLRYVDDVEGMGQYAWTEAVWQVVVDSIEDTQRKLCRGPLSEVQLNGLCLLIQVQETAVRAYMDTDEYRFYVEDGEGVLSFDERLRRAREAYAKEKEANRRIRAEIGFGSWRNVYKSLALGAGHGDGGQGAEGRDGATCSGATQTVGTSKPSGLGGAATQDPRSPPNDVNVNLSAVTEGGRTCYEDVLEEGDSGNGQNVGPFAMEADVQSEPAVEAGNERYEEARPAGVGVGDSSSAAVAEAIHCPMEIAADDGNSVPPTTDSVPVSHGDAVQVNQPPNAGDGGHCCTTSTTSTGVDLPTCRRSSNIDEEAAPYSETILRAGVAVHKSNAWAKVGRKGWKPTDSVGTGCRDRSPSTVHGEIQNDEDVVSVVPIAVDCGRGEVDAHAYADAAVKDDDLDTSTFDPSPHVPAARTRGMGSTFLILEEGVKVYLTRPLSPTEVDLLAAVRARCKGLKDSQWNFELPEASDKHVNAEFLKGLINVVPTRGAADRPGRYCIGAFAVHMYCKLLHLRQRQHKRYCRMSAFLDRHDQKVAIALALMKVAEFTDVLRWEMKHTDCPQQDNGHDCSVYMLMFMDLLSMRADGVYFGRTYVRHARDKLLLSLLQGSIAHFPEAFLQGT